MQPPQLDNLGNISAKAAEMVGLIIAGNIPHKQAMGIVMGMIDALARLSGNREVFWSGIHDMIDVVAEETRSSHEIH